MTPLLHPAAVLSAVPPTLRQSRWHAQEQAAAPPSAAAAPPPPPRPRPHMASWSALAARPGSPWSHSSSDARHALAGVLVVLGLFVLAALILLIKRLYRRIREIWGYATVSRNQPLSPTCEPASPSGRDERSASVCTSFERENAAPNAKQ